MTRTDFESKKEYANILRAQLSKYELAILLYNSISVLGRDKMLPLIKKYRFLKYLEKDTVMNSLDRTYVMDQDEKWPI